jgi:hypothetical protein
VTAEGPDQACRFLASLGFPFALRGYANERTAHAAPRLRPCVRGSLDGTGRMGGTPEVRADSRKAGLFIQAIVSLSRMCTLSLRIY